MAEAFEYAIKKDIRNNPIVREVDEARQREQWKSVGIAGLLVVVLLFAAWQRVELVRSGYAFEKLQQQLAVEEEAGRQLRVRIDMLKSPGRIEEFATKRLRLVNPGVDEAIVIERVEAPPPPAPSVVARR